MCHFSTYYRFYSRKHLISGSIDLFVCSFVKESAVLFEKYCDVTSESIPRANDIKERAVFVFRIILVLEL